MTDLRPRKPLPGYPIEEPFKSREAIEDYLSDDRIICLLCGRPFKALCGHLTIHGITGDEYKDRYNIPYSFGLARETTRKKISEHQKSLLVDPKRRERLAKMVKENAERRISGLKKARPRRDFIVAENTQRALLYAGREEQFSDTEKAAILNALDAGMTREEAVLSIGYSQSAYYDNIKKDKAFKKAVEIAIEAQPFALQAKQQRLGKRFEDECRRLLKKGYSDHIMADMLGVTAMSVNRRTKKMRAGQ